MSDIRATCPTCGDVTLPPARVTVIVWPEGHDYRFACDCGRIVSRPCSPRIVDLLVGAGVHVQPPFVERRDGPPVSLDDLIDLGLCLAAADPVAALTR